MDCIQANKISHGGLSHYDRFSKVPAGIAKGAEIRVQGSGKRVTLRSYGQRSFIMCSHWKRVCRIRFIMCSHWIRALADILDMCLMPLAVCAWWLFLILTFVFHVLISLCGLMGKVGVTKDMHPLVKQKAVQFASQSAPSNIS